MPTLPLTLPAPIDGGEVPVRSTSDVAAAEPRFVQQAAAAPVRDAIRTALTAMFRWYQRAARYAAAQSDILRATDIYLDGLGQDLQAFKQLGEDEEGYRTRALSVPDVVTPEAVLAAVGDVLAPYTDVLPQYAECVLDQWFLEDGTATWSSHVWNRNNDHAPNYPDRLYADQEDVNGGYARPQSNPAGALPMLQTSTPGREFIFRIPDLANVDNNVAYAFSDAAGTDALFGLFVGDGTEAVDMTFVFSTAETEDAIYAAVINAVERIKPHGTRWTLYVDPNLTA